MSVELQKSTISNHQNGAHPPLRRIARRSLFNDRLDSNHSLFGSRESTLLESHDSCYSSCSEESHSSLSREPSDAVAIECTVQPAPSSSHLSPSYSRYVGFATKLGYTEEQLSKVLEILGENAGQDQILSELIKLRRTLPESSVQSSKILTAPIPISLRSIVIDGSNIAMAHGRKEVFSCAGIKECVQFFKRRGHTDILVFVPQFRREIARSDCPITDQHILEELDREKILVWTPSRHIGGRRIVCHDDRYILKTAEEKDAVIVSNDEYRDLIKENPQYRKLVEQRLLMYTFVDGKFLPPDDPLGRRGPKLSQFLSKTPQKPSAQLCPYGRKCTYGNKCKYFHPERPNGLHVSVTERLIKGKQVKPVLKQCFSARNNCSNRDGHKAVSRTRSFNVLHSDCLEQDLQQQCNLKDTEPKAVFDETKSGSRHPYLLKKQRQAWQHHATLNRNLSAPDNHRSAIIRGPFLREESIDLSNQCSSSDFSPVHRVASSHQHRSTSTSVTPAVHCLQDCYTEISRKHPSHLFAPSLAIWGDPEYGVGPLTRSKLGAMNSLEYTSRIALRDILQLLFPESAVSAVMDANPDENDPQKLCAFILEYQKCLIQ